MEPICELLRHMISNDHGEWQMVTLAASDWWFWIRLHAGTWGHRIGRFLL